MNIKALEATSIYFRQAVRSLTCQFRSLRAFRDYKFDCEIEKDDGTFESFSGFHVQHDQSRGQMIGGIRFHHMVEHDEVEAMAQLMTWKAGLFNVPFGGSMSAVKCQPTELSTTEVERVAHAFTEQIYNVIGNDHTYILLPDLGTNAQTIAWVRDEDSDLYREYYREFETRKPIFYGGSPERKSATGYATGYGVFYATEALLKDHGKSIEGSTFVIQGFGNVGSCVARLFHQSGGKIVAVSDVTGALKNKNGIDIPALLKHKETSGSLSGFEEAENMNADELLVQDCDVLVPCALGGVINGENACHIKAKFIIEGADHATDPIADEILSDRRVTILPDIYANAGSVIVNYFDWFRMYKRYWLNEGTVNTDTELWTEDKVNYQLKKCMVEAYGRMTWICRMNMCNLRTGAMILGDIPAFESRHEKRRKI